MLLWFSLHASQYRYMKHGYFTIVTESHRGISLVTKPASSRFTMYHSEVLFLILDSKSALRCISSVVHAYAINMETWDNKLAYLPKNDLIFVFHVHRFLHLLR